MRLAMPLVLATLVSPACLGGTYPQLLSERFETGATLPEGFARPRPAFDFVAKEKLPEGAKVLSAARAGDKVWVVTDRGAFRSAGDRFEPLEIGPKAPEPGQPSVVPSARVSAVAGDSVGHIWVATDRGLYVTDGAQWWQGLDRRDGVPIEVISCLHLAPNGDVWAGTPEGAWRLRDGHFRYFGGRRWLPDNRVEAIWSDARGRVYLQTAGGSARIEEKRITLGQKAEHYDEIAWGRHNRRGYLCWTDLKVPGQPSKGADARVSDNDGLWTSMYVAAMALRFGATRDPAAREHARGSMKALLDLERLSGIPGYLARSMVTDDEIRAGVEGVNLEGLVHAPGDTSKIWFRSKVDPTLWCKGDTSSDALVGPYFAFHLYYDLVADEAEKKDVADVVRRVTDRIIDGGLDLIGHTGNKTRWGIWSPELINHHPFYYDLRPLNSLEILAFLKVAEHVTGDAKYTRVADDLIEKHHYLLNGLMMRRGATGQWPDINHGDDELLYMSYYPLLMMEKDPARRRILVQSIARTWEDSATEQGIRPEHSPFYNFIYGATTGRRCDVEAATQSLEDWPWELVDWTTTNSRRHDVRVLSAPGIHRHPTQADRVLPPSERSQGRWNASPWVPDGGSDGRVEHDGVAWTLGYWLGVYHGYLPVEK